MGLEAATFVSQLVSTNPVFNDLKRQGDDHLRLLKSVMQATLPNASKAFYFPDSSAKTGAYTILASDMNKLITGDASGGAFNLTLPTLAAGDAGWTIDLAKSDSSANAVTVVGTINGVANLALAKQYDGVRLKWSGSSWFALHLPLAQLNIANGTALTAPAVGDELPINDVSVPGNRKITLSDMLKVIGLLTAETAPASDDILALFDTSAGTADGITLQNFFNVINVLTAETVVADANDSVVMYDASATAARKVLLTNLFNAARTITAAWAFSNAAGIAAPNTIKAFGTIDGNALVAGSFGVASWDAANNRITLTTALPDTNYTCQMTARDANNAAIPSWEPFSTSVIQVGCFNSAVGVVDPQNFSFMVLHNS